MALTAAREREQEGHTVEHDETPGAHDTRVVEALIARTTHPTCYGHRGARAYLPENTLASFNLAFDLGAEAIECDVQRSRDEALVILHDGTLQRTTNGSGLVAAHTIAELRQVNAGGRRRFAASVPLLVARIPTLEETLALVRARGGGLNLEVKGESVHEAVDTARAVVPVLAALPPEERARILVSSFALPAVAEVKRLLPEQRVAALYGGRVWRRRDMLAPALEMGAEAIHPGVDLVTRPLLARAHAAGLRVNVWTANLPWTIRRLVRWGVDGLFSDYPDRVVIARAQHAAQHVTLHAAHDAPLRGSHAEVRE